MSVTYQVVEARANVVVREDWANLLENEGSIEILADAAAPQPYEYRPTAAAISRRTRELHLAGRRVRVMPGENDSRHDSEGLPSGEQGRAVTKGDGAAVADFLMTRRCFSVRASWVHPGKGLAA